MEIHVFSAFHPDTKAALFIAKDEDGNRLWEISAKGVFPIRLQVYENVRPLVDEATLREQIAREIGEMQINFPDPNSLSGVKELTGTEVKFKAIAIARGSEG